jgi:hypothetical protein
MLRPAFVSAFALPWTLAGYVMLAISFFGWGRFASRALGTEASARADGAIIIFVGWAVSLLVFQVANFVSPIDAWVAIPVFAAGIVMSLTAFVRRDRNAQSRLHTRWIVFAAVGFCVAAIWVAARGLYLIENFDSGLYHLPTIRWINEYPIVPGLGNLHGRLAFNQSFFTYAAALNAGWFHGHEGGASNGFLILVLLLQSIQGLTSRFRLAPEEREKSPLTWVVNLLVLPVIAYLALSSDGLSSPTPDLAATLLEVSMFMIFVRGVGEWTTGGEPPHFYATILPLLAATAITVKLSTIAFAGTIIVACIMYEIHPSYRDARVLRRTLLRLVPAAVIVIVWLARGVVLSGCPLYPTTVGCLGVDWMIPQAKIVNEANWVYSWAREPGIHWRFVLGKHDWMQLWIARESHDFLGLVFPLASAIIFVVAAAVMRRAARLRGSATTFAGYVIFIPLIVGIAFWFVTAPDPRFGRAFFWMLSITAGLVFLADAQPLLDGRRYRQLTIALFVALNAPFFAYAAARGGERLTRISLSGWQHMWRARLVTRQTTSGLILYTPTRDDRCWDSPIPCTPYFNPDLALRVNGRIDRGFVDLSPLRRSLGPSAP